MRSIPALIALWGLTMAAFACHRPDGNRNEAVPAPARAPVENEAGEKTIVLAAGCFWCVEAVYSEIDGVVDAESGYAGGREETADYDLVSSGQTNHAEVVRVTYDPSRVTLGQILNVFFASHDPTTKDRQGPDMGRQYRSAIFYADENEKQIARAYIEQLDAAATFRAPIVTTLEPLEGFYPAESYHQDFAERNPDHPYIRIHSKPKVEKVRKAFEDLTKPGD